ncbi:hypothetical protein WA026_015715 [Henosepilachna vigintioctopunctata]|uniref:Uncharacterized protein n=1 Tax=Henosepilachna vigintioctopunctata TaxID=420089 RepID=A0AAW1URM8_9CUCU
MLRSISEVQLGEELTMYLLTKLQLSLKKELIGLGCGAQFHVIHNAIKSAADGSLSFEVCTDCDDLDKVKNPEVQPRSVTHGTHFFLDQESPRLMSYSFSFMNLNIRSAKNKFPQPEVWLNFMGYPEVICLMEIGRDGGGVAILVQNDIVFDQLDLGGAVDVRESLEVKDIRVFNRDEFINLFCIYRDSSSNCELFFVSLEYLQGEVVGRSE